MKNLILVSIISLGLVPAFSQGVPELPQEAYQLYPTLEEMYGYAVGQIDQHILILGGKIRTDAPEIYSEDFPNTEIILINLGANKASAFASGALDDYIGEQMAATGFGYYQEGNLLFLVGGYGYSETHQQFTTFPFLTIIDLPGAIEALKKGEEPVDYFAQVCDDRIAVYDGLMDYNGDLYFLLNGKKAYKKDPFEDYAEYTEEALDQQVRTFRVTGGFENPEIKDFNTWYDLTSFQEYFGPLIPPQIQQELIRLQQNITDH